MLPRCKQGGPLWLDLRQLHNPILHTDALHGAATQASVGPAECSAESPRSNSVAATPRLSNPNIPSNRQALRRLAHIAESAESCQPMERTDSVQSPTEGSDETCMKRSTAKDVSKSERQVTYRRGLLYVLCRLCKWLRVAPSKR